MTGTAFDPEEQTTRYTLNRMADVLDAADKFETGWSACYLGCGCVRCKLAQSVRALRRTIGAIS